MKKIALLLFSIIMMVACVTSISACEKKETPHSHTYVAWKYDNDKHWKDCSCGEKSELANHNWDAGVITTPATKEVEGVKTFTCTDCGNTKTEKIDKLPENHIHSYVAWKYDDDKHWKDCTCGQKINEASHDFGVGIITKSAQVGQEGIRTFTCECGKTKNETVPALTKPAAQINGMDAVNLDKEYDGNVVVAPTSLTTTNNDAGANIVFKWYKGSTKLENAPKDAGTYTLLAIVDETANFSTVEEGKQFTISAKEITVTWTAPQNLEYNNVAKLASATVSSGLVGEDVANIQVTGVNNVKPGLATYTAVSTNTNYVIANANQGYTITPHALNAINLTKEYDGTNNLQIKLTTEHGLMDNDDDITLAVTFNGVYPAISGDNYSKHIIISAVTVGANASYYSMKTEDVSITVVPKKVTLNETISVEYSAYNNVFYPLTLLDGVIDGDLGKAVWRILIDSSDMYVGNNKTILATTDKEVLVNGYCCYEIQNLPKINIVPAVYKNTFENVEIDYSGANSVKFAVDYNITEKVYLVADVEDKDITGNPTALSNIRLDLEAPNSGNVSGVAEKTGTAVIAPRAITLEHEVTYTGSTITIPTQELSSANNVLGSDDVKISITLADSDVSDCFYLDGELVFMPKENVIATLSGANASNYRIDNSKIKVFVKPIVLSNLPTTVSCEYDGGLGEYVLDLTTDNGILASDVANVYKISVYNGGHKDVGTYDNTVIFLSEGSNRDTTIQSKANGVIAVKAHYMLPDDYQPTFTITPKPFSAGIMDTICITEDEVYEQNGRLYYDYRLPTNMLCHSADEVILQLELLKFNDNQELTTDVVFGSHFTQTIDEFVEGSRSGANVSNYSFSTFVYNVVYIRVFRVLSGSMTTSPPSLNASFMLHTVNNDYFDMTNLVGLREGHHIQTLATLTSNSSIAKVDVNYYQYIDPNTNVQYNYMFADDFVIYMDWSKLP